MSKCVWFTVCVNLDVCSAFAHCVCEYVCVVCVSVCVCVHVYVLCVCVCAVCVWWVCLCVCVIWIWITSINNYFFVPHALHMKHAQGTQVHAHLVKVTHIKLILSKLFTHFIHMYHVWLLSSFVCGRAVMYVTLKHMRTHFKHGYRSSPQT